MFLNRVNELADLEARYGSRRAEFIILQGRRRVGKTSVTPGHWNRSRFSSTTRPLFSLPTPRRNSWRPTPWSAACLATSSSSTTGVHAGQRRPPDHLGGRSTLWHS